MFAPGPLLSARMVASRATMLGWLPFKAIRFVPSVESAPDGRPNHRAELSLGNPRASKSVLT